MVEVHFILNEDDATLPFREEFNKGVALVSTTDLVIVVTFGFQNLEKAGDVASAPTLLVDAIKDLVSVGPLHVPGKSACFSCLDHWLAADRACADRPIFLPGREEARAAAELVLQLHRAGTAPRSTVQMFDLAKQNRSIHPIFPLHDCRTCAAIKGREGYDLRVHCSSITGIVQHMQLTRTPTAGAYRAMATWISPLPVREARPLLAPQRSHGRGRTPEEAERGCIGEALERYSVIYRGDEPLQRARLDDVAGVDPRQILLYSDKQYESRKSWNASTDDRYFVGKPFDPSQVIEWFPAVDLIDGAPALVPAGCALMWYTFPRGESEYARADTIGCGSGRTFDDALAHALLEWIERDAMAIWWYNRIRRPAVRLESFDAPELLEIRSALRRIDRELVLLDCTTDISVPTYMSVAARSDGSEPLFAGASHPSPRIAAWKAASEVGQLWFTIMHSQEIDVEMRDWLTTTTDQQTFLKPTHEIDAPPEPPPLHSGALVQFVVDRVSAVGLRPYAADLSRTDVVLKTARAFVPGLRHIWNRRAPGRLYDVPVHLGWLDSPLDECELNSICCMI